ncbi:MAG: hypothetical protein IJZ37_07035 [Clostridia bacterium]|nr:hypothetical protein [Clostridia bacterium]MBQ8236417.1 hypothetical protein [Clostridia bacterium]MBQ8398612.1 hypothetical protein [Clostridia bacterium]
MEKIHPADRAANDYLQQQRDVYQKGKHADVLVAVLFLVLIFGLLLLHVILPDKEYSKRENKSLASFPEFSLSALLKEDGEKGAQKSLIADYLEDQFPLRDQFMMLDGARQFVLTFGQSNGVLSLKDGTLLPLDHTCKEEEPATYKVLLSTIKAYEQSACFTGKYETVFALAGRKSAFVSDLPADYPKSIIKHNRTLAKSLLKDSGCTPLDLTTVFEQYAAEQLYYKSDHHWTSLGAYYASAEILKQYGKELAALDSFTKEIATEDFSGTAYNASGLYFLGGEKIEYFRYEGDEEYTVSLCNALGKVQKQRKGFYDLSALEEEHWGTAYDSFVSGVDTPIVRITKEGEERPTLLVIKDSFAHSALPFLAQEFDLITVDVRHKNFSLPNLLEEGEIDGILVLMSEETLLS